MSTIKVNTIKDTSGTEVYTAKAWVNFNGTGTVAIRGSGNVSSITDNGVGNYTINFATSMPDGNYAVSLSASNAAGSATWMMVGMTGPNGNSNNFSTANMSANSVKITTTITSQAAGDVEYAGVAIFR